MSPLWTRAAERVSARLLAGAPAQGPSAVAVGISDGESEPTVVARGHGRALGDDGRPIDPVALADDPVFDVGSVTKVVVTTALMMSLVDRGTVRLDDAVAHWLPDFAGAGKDAATVRDLLEHHCGLWEWWPTYACGAPDRVGAVDVVQGLPLRYEPGSGRHYSDLGFMLLGDIVARELGESLDVAAQRHVLAPLGMAASGFRPARAAGPADGVVATSLGDWYEQRMLESGSPYPVPVSADAFTGWRTHVLVGEANDGNCWHGFGGVAGHAGLFTTASDLLRFGRALVSSLDGAGPWSADVVAEFLRPGRAAGQALGFRVADVGTGSYSCTVVGHPGFPGAHLGIVPEQRLVVVLLTNRLHTSGEPRTLDGEWSQLLVDVSAR